MLRTTLKMIFSICTLRFQIFKYCPNHTSMEISYIQLSDDAYTSHDPYDCFCAPGSRLSNSTFIVRRRFTETLPAPAAAGSYQGSMTWTSAPEATPEQRYGSCRTCLSPAWKTRKDPLQRCACLLQNIISGLTSWRYLDNLSTSSLRTVIDSLIHSFKFCYNVLVW